MSGLGSEVEGIPTEYDTPSRSSSRKHSGGVKKPALIRTKKAFKNVGGENPHIV